MPMDPTRITDAQLCDVRHNVARSYGIELYRQYPERQAANLLVAPNKRQDVVANVSTLKRKRRADKIPYVPLGDGSIAYLGMMLCDFIAFGERSVLLWGGRDDRCPPSNPTGSAAPSS